MTLPDMTDPELEQAIARMRPRHRAWFDHFIANPARDATAAAVHAGLGKTRSAQSTLGARLKRRYRHLLEAYDNRMAAASVMSPREVQERLAELARGSIGRPADRIKAYEIIARIHGMLSDKLSVDVDSSDLRRAFGAMAAMRAGSSAAGALSAGPAAQAEPEPVDALVLPAPDPDPS